MFDLSLLNLPRSGILVDVGANLGAFYRCARDYMEPKQSLCVEMLGDLACLLKQDPYYHYPDEGRYVEHCACGERRGMAITRRTRFHPASSLLACNMELGRRLGMDFSLADGQETVKLRTLDELCEKHAISRIDLLKIDVQGYEARVLRGAQEILKQTDRVIIEVILMPHYEGQSEPWEIRGLLMDAGLEFSSVLHRDVISQTGECWEQDELWMRSGL